MITFFSIPKPFHGHIGMIQFNAIRSWTRLGEQVRIVLMGDEPGTAEAARELGVSHLPDIVRNRYGTPLLNSLFEAIEDHDDHPYRNYINADIILTDDFVTAFRSVRRTKNRFLMVGQRTDLHVKEPIDFTGQWQTILKEQARRVGRLQGPPWIDYFAYRRDMWGKLPPFAVGRFSWDNWMIYRARCLSVPVIDATSRVLAIHQNHDYAHAGGQKKARFGPEARFNLALAGGRQNLYPIWDSTHVLTSRGLELRRATTGCLGGGIWSYRRSVKMGVA